MTLSTAQYVRLRIQDVPAIWDQTLYGDGTADTFVLNQRNQTSATAFVPIGAGGGTAWSATGASFDSALGSVAFSGVISANSAVRVRYVYSVFSDDEINTFITAGGGMNGAALEAVQVLLFDAPKRAVWKAPDGSMYDDTAAQQALRALYDVAVDRQAQEAVGQGGISEWGANQQYY